MRFFPLPSRRYYPFHEFADGAALRFANLLPMLEDETRGGAPRSSMRHRFEDAQRIRVRDTALVRPSLDISAEALRAHFDGPIGCEQTRLQNPHLESRVTAEQEARATPASVLLAVVQRDDGPTVLLTQRHHGISNPGDWVFPGGRRDEGDASPIETALREAEEEIGRDRPDRAHFTLETGVGAVWLTGVTVAIAMGLYSQLLETIGPQAG